MMRRLISLALVCAACSDDDTSPRDAGVDAAIEAGMDASAKCEFSASFRFSWSGAFGRSNLFRTVPPDVIEVERVNVADGGSAGAACSFKLPTCGEERDDVGDLNSLLTHPDVTAAFRDDPQLIGRGFSLNSDFLFFTVERSDGKKIRLGDFDACDAGLPADGCVLASFRDLRNALGRISERANEVQGCAS